MSVYLRDYARVPRLIANPANDYDNLTEKGDNAYEEGEYQTALGFYQQALTIAKETDDQEKEALALHNIGYSYLKQELFDEAIENCRKP